MKKKVLDELIKAKGLPMKREYAKALRAIKKYDHIVVFRHIMPDYDALGTQMGLATWLKDNFPNKTIKVVGDNHVTFTPRLFPVMDTLNDEWFETPFLTIVVDVSGKSRIADPRWKKGKKKIIIDHHPESDITKNVIRDTTTAAASELVVNMILNFKGDYKLTQEAARYFYIALVGDSGRFQYSSTTPHTFAIAKELVETGINLPDIYSKMYQKSIDDLYVTAYVLGNFKVSEHGVAYYLLPDQIQKDLKITSERGKENVNIFAPIVGVNAWCSITEDKKDNCWRISIRSKGTPINGVAAMFGGGGHAQASGARIDSLDELPLFIEELDKLFI
jgi:phosphoesterase RecJ-like protein